MVHPVFMHEPSLPMPPLLARIGIRTAPGQYAPGVCPPAPAVWRRGEPGP